MFDLHPASSAVQAIQAPKSDPGAKFGDQNDAPNTSGIFVGSSRDKATAWRINRTSGNTPNAAYVGKSAITFGDDNQPYKPVEMR
jgi:hypothetical protein